MPVLQEKSENTLDTKRRSRLPYTTYSTRHPYGLTRRENEVWGLLASGYTNRQIANALGITVVTVENHTTMILDRLPIGGAFMVRRLRAALLYHGITFHKDEEEDR